MPFIFTVHVPGVTTYRKAVVLSGGGLYTGAMERR